jgi:hypothetical protein
MNTTIPINSILEIENILKKMDESLISISLLKRKLPEKYNNEVIKIILDYLEKNNKIYQSPHGITWIANTNTKLKRDIKKGFGVLKKNIWIF